MDSVSRGPSRTGGGEGVIRASCMCFCARDLSTPACEVACVKCPLQIRPQMATFGMVDPTHKNCVITRKRSIPLGTRRTRRNPLSKHTPNAPNARIHTHTHTPTETITSPSVRVACPLSAAAAAAAACLCNADTPRSARPGQINSQHTPLADSHTHTHLPSDWHLY